MLGSLIHISIVTWECTSSTGFESILSTLSSFPSISDRLKKILFIPSTSRIVIRSYIGTSMNDRLLPFSKIATLRRVFHCFYSIHIILILTLTVMNNSMVACFVIGTKTICEVFCFSDDICTTQKQSYTCFALFKLFKMKINSRR